MTVGESFRRKKSAVQKIARTYGAKHVRLFGSVARGDDTESSDLDLLVDMKKSSTLLDIIAIKQDVEDLLGVDVHVVTESSLSPYIRKDILKEAVDL